MAGNIGYFMGGMAKGLTSGANLGMQITQIKWQKKKQKELDDMNLKMNDTWNSIGQELITLANDGQLSEDDKLKIYTLTIAAPYEMQGVMQNLRGSLAQFDTKGFDKQMELVKAFYEYGQGLDITNIDALYETFRGQFTDPHALALYKAADKKLRHEVEVAKEEEPWRRAAILPSEMRAPYLKQEGVEMPEVEMPTKEQTYNEKRFNWKVKQVRLGNMTLDQLIESEGVKISPEKATGLEKQIQDIKTQGKAAGIPTDQIDTAIKNKILGISGVGDKEGEISAGEKRTFDMVSSVMFGSSDWVTGISKPGIISQSISNKLNMGQSLTEEEKSEVRNNYNAIKDTFPDEVRTGVESQLKRFGIPLEVTAPPQPIMGGLPTSKPEDKPSIIEKGVDKVKSLLGVGGTPPTGEIPIPKVPPEAKEAQIPLMTKEELEEAIKGLDPKDPMYKLLYAEAVKRGYVTK